MTAGLARRFRQHQPRRTIAALVQDLEARGRLEILLGRDLDRDQGAGRDPPAVEKRRQRRPRQA